MGDIADDHYNQMLDGGYFPSQSYRSCAPRPAICNRCGKQGLTWHPVKQSWVLINEVGDPHVCDATMLKNNLIDDFEDLDE